MIDAKRKGIIFLSLAFILAVIAAGLILNEVRKVQESFGETVEVAVAKNSVESYTEVSENKIEWKDVPKTEQSSAFIMDESELENTISIVNIEEGEYLTKNILRSRIDIPANHRVVWLNPTENVIVDQSVAEGDLVDVLVTHENNEQNIVTERILENIQVVQSRETSEGQDAIKVALNVQNSEQLIYFQNTAEQIRVLRVNQVPEKAENSSGKNPPEKENSNSKSNDKKSNNNSEENNSNRNNN